MSKNICVPHILQSYCQLILFWWPETFNNGIEMKQKYANNHTAVFKTVFLFINIVFCFYSLKQIQGR